MFLGWWSDLLPLEFKDDTFNSCSETDAGCVGTAKYFGQTIVTPATVEREFIQFGGELKDGARIVIQATHEQWIEGARHVIELKKPLYCCKVFATWLTEILGALGGGSNLRLILRFFAIEQAQRVLIETHLAIGTA